MSAFAFLAILCLSSHWVDVDSKAAEGKHVLSEVDMKLKLLNKPGVKTIQSEDGDIIDCVDIYKQPAFDHPALKNHKIQREPSFAPITVDSTAENLPYKILMSQTWHKNGSCPEGTVPIRRVKREEISGAKSLNQFGRKRYHGYQSLNNSKSDSKHGRELSFNTTAVNLGPSPNRSTELLVATAYNFIGAKADINAWNPNVESPSEDYSNAQIWLMGGPSYSFESIESGWTVDPSLFGDRNTRLFIYWTTDSYKSTGCFNLVCPGFVQTSSIISLGAMLEPLSSHMGTQYAIRISIYLDPVSKNWWLHYGDYVVGYWPGSLFGYLQHSANLVQWGGQVYSPHVKTHPHTKTAMGSGAWAAYLYGAACFITNVRVVDYSLQVKYPQVLGTWGEDWDCYSLQHWRQGYMTEPYFFFGGPGRNPRCP